MGDQNTRRLLLVFVAIASLIGCAPTHHASIQNLDRPTADAGLLLMPLDVQLTELSAGGVAEPKAEWTESAVRNMTAVMEGLARQHGRRLVTFEDVASSDGADDAHHQLVSLHAVTGGAILKHMYTPGQQLPTKRNRLDWSLGPEAVRLRDETGADYALFVFVRDSYTGPGRTAMIVAGALLGAVTGVYVHVPGGAQVGFASLVDLDTGNVVWFNRLARESGDLREMEGARETVDALLAGFPS